MAYDFFSWFKVGKSDTKVTADEEAVLLSPHSFEAIEREIAEQRNQGIDPWPTLVAQFDTLDKDGKASFSAYEKLWLQFKALYKQTKKVECRLALAVIGLTKLHTNESYVERARSRVYSLNHFAKEMDLTLMDTFVRKFEEFVTAESEKIPEYRARQREHIQKHGSCCQGVHSQGHFSATTPYALAGNNIGELKGALRQIKRYYVVNNSLT